MPLGQKIEDRLGSPGIAIMKEVGTENGERAIRVRMSHAFAQRDSPFERSMVADQHDR